MGDSELEKLFAGLCRRRPLKRSLQGLREYPSREHVIEFLVQKLAVFINEIDTKEGWDGALEWGVTHAAILLGEFKAPSAGPPLVGLLDRVKDDPDAELHNSAMLALEKLGRSALEPAYQKYQRDKNHVERRPVWLWVLANLGVHDDRIHQALLDHMAFDSDEAVLLMGDYGDRGLLPMVESYVINLARYLNDHRIDPFAKGARFEDSLVASYIDNRESLVMLKERIPPDHPTFDEKVESLDRQLLKYAEYGVYDEPRETPRKPLERTKPGRNDPCPCGSGKKYKRCCGSPCTCLVYMGK